MKFTSWLTLITALIAITLATGCTGGAATADNSSGDGNEDSAYSSGAFYVTAQSSEQVRSHVRTVGSFGTSCSISPTASSQNLSCIIDVPEGDIYFNGLTITHNVPPGMCRYFRRYTYWYWNQEVGYGPATVRVNKVLDADGNVTSIQCGADGGAVGSCATQTEISYNTEDDEVTCKYDRTSVNRANCCFGEYVLTEQVTADDGSVTTTVAEKSWGGEARNCIGGPGRTDWEHTTVSGIPRGVEVYSVNGLSDDYKITAPIQNPNGIWNISVANYYTPAVHSHDGYVSATASTLPYFIDPIDDRSGTTWDVPGNVPYIYECLDEAYEIRHRISVYVREWDLYTDYLAYIASAGVTEVPDRPGDAEGVDCDGIDGLCNDRWDLDDFINENLQAPYDTATPATRGLNFPNQDYE